MHQTDINDDLVGQIAGFTSLRDADLLELSLLKSIFSIVNPFEVSLVTIDGQNSVKKKVDFASGRTGSSSAVPLDPSCFSLACEQLDTTSLEYCTVAHGSKSLSLFMLNQGRRLADLVAIQTRDSGISKMHAEQISGMLTIYRNFRALIKESQTDELTGLANRRTFEHSAKNIHESIVTAPVPAAGDRRQFSAASKYWLAMFDIDHFKRVNDTQGHLMGDEVLVRVAQTLQCSMRAEDLLYRYGGEEFAAIIRAERKNNCNDILERARQSVESLIFPNIGKITVSIGAAEMDPMSFYMSNIEKADQALYHSKENGRNKLTFYADMGDTGSAASSEQGASDIDLF